MSSNVIGTLVTINNFAHDLAAAFLFTSMLLAWLLYRHGELSPAVIRSLNKWTWGSLAWVIVGGVIRTLTYKQYYEWVAGGGERQIALLIVKHMLILILVAGGLYFMFRLNREGKKNS